MIIQNRMAMAIFNFFVDILHTTYAYSDGTSYYSAVIGAEKTRLSHFIEVFIDGVWTILGTILTRALFVLTIVLPFYLNEFAHLKWTIILCSVLFLFIYILVSSIENDISVISFSKSFFNLMTKGWMTGIDSFSLCLLFSMILVNGHLPKERFRNIITSHRSDCLHKISYYSEHGGNHAYSVFECDRVKKKLEEGSTFVKQIVINEENKGSRNIYFNCALPRWHRFSDAIYDCNFNKRR